MKKGDNNNNTNNSSSNNEMNGSIIFSGVQIEINNNYNNSGGSSSSTSSNSNSKNNNNIGRNNSINNLNEMQQNSMNNSTTNTNTNTTSSSSSSTSTSTSKGPPLKEWVLLSSESVPKVSMEHKNSINDSIIKNYYENNNNNENTTNTTSSSSTTTTSSSTNTTSSISNSPYNLRRNNSNLNTHIQDHSSVSSTNSNASSPNPIIHNNNNNNNNSVNIPRNGSFNNSLNYDNHSSSSNSHSNTSTTTTTTTTSINSSGGINNSNNSNNNNNGDIMNTSIVFENNSVNSILMSSDKNCTHQFPSDEILVGHEHEIMDLALNKEFLNQYRIQTNSIFINSQPVLNQDVQSYQEYESLLTLYNNILLQISRNNNISSSSPFYNNTNTSTTSTTSSSTSTTTNSMNIPNTTANTSSNSNGTTPLLSSSPNTVTTTTTTSSSSPSTSPFNNHNNNIPIDSFLIEIESLLNKITLFYKNIDVEIFNRLGNNVKLMFDHLNLIKGDIIEGNHTLLRGQFAILNHTVINSDKSTKQYVFRFLYSLAPLQTSLHIVVTPELKKVCKIHFTKPVYTPLCIEFKGSFTFSKLYTDLFKSISLYLSQVGQHFFLSHPIINNDELLFIPSIYGLFESIQYLSNKEESFYIEYILHNLKFISHKIPKQTREFKKQEIERLATYIKGNPFYVKEILPKLLKNIYVDPYFYHLWNNNCIHLLNNTINNTNNKQQIIDKDIGNDLTLLLNSNKNSFLLSFDEKYFSIFYTTTTTTSSSSNSSNNSSNNTIKSPNNNNNRNVVSSSNSNNSNNNNNNNQYIFNCFDNTTSLLNFIESNQFKYIILSNKEVETIKFFKSVLPVTLPLPANRQTIQQQQQQNYKPRILCGSCLSRFKLILDELDQEESIENQIYLNYINKLNNNNNNNNNSNNEDDHDHNHHEGEHVNNKKVEDEDSSDSSDSIDSDSDSSNNSYNTDDGNNEKEIELNEIENQIKEIEKQEQDLIKEYLELENQNQINLDIKQKLEDILKEIKSEEKAHYDMVNNYYQEYFDLKQEDEIWCNQISATKNQIERVSNIDINKISFKIELSGGNMEESVTTTTTTTGSSISTINGFRLGTLTNLKVDWEEINSAWGETSLLLYVLASQLEFNFTNYKLIPMSNKSMIQSKSSDKISYTLYGGDNIQFSRSFLWFSASDQRFDNGMEAFLSCVNDIISFIQSKYLPTLSFNYRINKDKIGDSNRFHSIKIANNSEQNWTMALRFMLANLKKILDNLDLIIESKHQLQQQQTSKSTSTSLFSSSPNKR